MFLTIESRLSKSEHLYKNLMKLKERISECLSMNKLLLNEA